MSIEFKLPDLGEGIHEAEILAVKVSEGDKVKEDQPILEVETDKAVVEIPSPVAGTIQKIHVKIGQLVTVGSVMITFEGESAKDKPAASPSKAVTPAKEVPSTFTAYSAPHISGNGPVPAAPAVRRLARELGIELNLVHGSGPAGRVLENDVRAFVTGGAPSQRSATAVLPQAKGQETIAPALSLAAPVELPDFSKWGPCERTPLKSIRRKTAINMAQSWSHIPHVTHMDEVDITSLEEFRAKSEAEISKQGGKLTNTVFMLMAIAAGLKKFPQFNSSLDERTSEIVYKHYYNIGIAVATERGLIVPVISNADQKSLSALAIELNEIAKKTREGKIELEKLQGSTFTITNVGAIGGTNMVPMINFPEAAILAMGRSQYKPVVRDGKIEIRLIMPLSMSFDHRIADGAEAAMFMRFIIEWLEQPFKMLVEV